MTRISVSEFFRTEGVRREREGLGPAGRTFERGDVVVVEDVAVDFPTERLRASGARASHPGRYVVIVQGSAMNDDDRVKTLSVVPCSASFRGGVPAEDFEIPADEPAFTKARVVAYASLLQAVLKSDVKARMGQLRPATLGGLLGRIRQNLGMLEKLDR